MCLYELIWKPSGAKLLGFFGDGVDGISAAELSVTHMYIFVLFVLIVAVTVKCLLSFCVIVLWMKPMEFGSLDSCLKRIVVGGYKLILSKSNILWCER